MELQAKFDRRINDIQRKLREVNYDCNRLKELFSDALAQVQPDTLNLERSQPRTKDNPLADGPESVSQAALTNQSAGQSPSITSKPSQESAGPESVKEPAVEATPLQRPPAVPPPVPPRRQAQGAGPRPPVRGRRTSAREQAAANAADAAAAVRPRGNMEKFIGENLLNKIGIGILVIGVGIFVKYAIDQDWIGHIGRVLIGLLTGGLLIGVAHYLRKKYKAFSSVLVGGGIATMYFSIAIAFQTYGLLSQPLAFGIMAVITVFSVIMAVGYDRQEIAIIGLLGGFATPFLVSTGEGSYVTLFTYIIIINLGAMFLSWFKDWKLTRVLSYGLTVLLFGGWAALNLFYFDTPEVGGVIAFATAFFTIFFGMNIAFSVKSQQKLKGLDFILLLSNSAFYFVVTMATLYWFDQGRYMGIFTALMGVFHFIFVFPAKKWVSYDDRLVKVLVGLVLTFVTAAVGIELEGSHLTIFWAIEAVILLVIARQTKMSLLERATVLMTFLTVMSLLRDWGMFYLADFGTGNTPILNGNFLTTLVATGSLFALSIMNKRLKPVMENAQGLSTTYRFMGIGLLYVGALFETIDQVIHLNDGVMVIAVATLTAYYLVGLHAWAMITKDRDFGNIVFSLSMLFFVALTVSQIMFIGPMREDFLSGYPSGDGFMARFWMTPAVFTVLALSFVHGRKAYDKDGNNLLLWGLSIVLVILTSVELDTILALAGVSGAHAHKIGYPILWGILGFGLIAGGMRYKLRHLRLAGLALFLLIIVKLFAYDIRSIPTGGKIAAFISLGVVLLVVSFMYQRLKRLVIEDDDEGE